MWISRRAWCQRRRHHQPHVVVVASILCVILTATCLVLLFFFFLFLLFARAIPDKHVMNHANIEIVRCTNASHECESCKWVGNCVNFRRENVAQERVPSSESTTCARTMYNAQYRIHDRIDRHSLRMKREMRCEWGLVDAGKYSFYFASFIRIEIQMYVNHEPHNETPKYTMQSLNQRIMRNKVEKCARDFPVFSQLAFVVRCSGWKYLDCDVITVMLMSFERFYRWYHSDSTTSPFERTENEQYRRWFISYIPINCE